MPNIKSAIKRVKVNEKKNAENKARKSQINTVVKKFEAAVKQGNREEAERLYNEAASVVDTAASKKVIHKNTASRKKARLNKLLSELKK